MRLGLLLIAWTIAPLFAMACASTEDAARLEAADARIAELTSERDDARAEQLRLEAEVARLRAEGGREENRAPAPVVAPDASGDKDARIAQLKEERDVAFAEQKRLMADNERLFLLVNERHRLEVTPPVPHITAQVSGVDPVLNIVLLSAGSDDDVQVGYEFIVYRGTEYVAKVVVRRVERDWCSGESRKEIQKSPIRVGDQATTRF